MKTIHIYLFLFFSFTLSSCSVIGDLLEAGFWAGFILASILWGGIIYLVKRFF